ncbi:hypothetical protein Bpfe_008351, partial [Biomphalaria pfeifferi]
VKTLPDKPDSGAYPFLSVFGKNLASVKLLNMACPSPALVEQWEQKKQFWSPGFMHNVLCDDQGILSCEESYTTEGERGIFICQESITKEHNTFSVKVIDLKTDGIITVGFGPENYSTNRHPGWDSGSVALHGDDGRVYIQSGSGSMPSTNELYIWKNGDVITAVVSGMGNSDTIQIKEEIEVDFYVNKKLISNVKTKLKNVNKGIRFVFMLGMRNVGTKAQIMNYRPVYIPPPAQMDMLTMGRSYYINAYDDGCLKYRPFGSRDSFGLFLSKTPFNYQLTYFECVVKSVGSKRHIGIGFAGRNYPINTMLGWRLSSVGYHADNGLLYHNSSSGHITIETESLQFNTGDVIGCGLDVATTKFRLDGSLENQQIIKFYFTKNGKRVHEVDFHYQSDGIYPGVNLHYNSDEVLLKNFYPGVEHGISELESVVEVDQEEEQSFIEGCRFTVVGMQENGVKLKGKIQILQQAFEDLTFSTIPVIEQHLQFLSSNIKTLDMQGQQLFGQLTWQKECLERFLHNKSRLKFLTVDVSSAEGHDELIKHIVKVCEGDLAYHSKLYEVQASVSKGLKKIVDKLSEEKLIDTETMRDLVGEELGLNGRIYEAAVRYLHAKGWLLHVPMKRTIVAIDLNFAQSLVTMSSVLSNTKSGQKVPCIGTETRIWNNITEIIPDAKSFHKEKLEILSHVLMFMGVMELRYLREKKSDPMFCYSTIKSIGELPVDLTDFIKSTNKDTILVEREYSFLYSSCKNVLSIIVSRSIRFARPVVIGPDWCVFQNGAAQTTLYIRGEQCLRLETRCYMPAQKRGCIDNETQFHMQEYAFNIFCLFTDIIDFVIGRLKLLAIFTEKVPPNMVNCSIGCIHNWGLSDDDYRQTLCTLCGQCCENGRNCPFNGLEGEYQHQCGCDTVVTGCEDCGICQECADFMWSIESYLRPNLEVASYGKLRSSQYISLNATTYDEVEFTNLGVDQAPICLKGSDQAGIITKMFPSSATELPSLESLEQHMKQLEISGYMNTKLMSFNQGDTVKIKLELIKRDPKTVVQMEEDLHLEITPVYFTCICREVTIWHDTGILVYTSQSQQVPVGQFISASPLTPECNSFSFEIISPGDHGYIAIGVCPKRYPKDRQPGWNSGSYGYHADDGGIFSGMGFASEHGETCTVGDVMKCEVDFENQWLLFYKNGKMIHTIERVRNFGNFHAAVGFHSFGEVVRLLEKEPWQQNEEEENDLPSAFDSYKYGNMCISPGKTLFMHSIKKKLRSWLMINNPSKSIVGYRIFPDEAVRKAIGYLEPNKCIAFRLALDLTKFENVPNVDVHWFLLESTRDYAGVDIAAIYKSTTAESLFKHRLSVKVSDIHSSESYPLRLATEEPSAIDFYKAEVIKNGISVAKYLLRGGKYVCYLPQKCDVLVRYPKFPTMNQPNSFQKGMRVILDLRKTEKDLYAEAIIEEVTDDGYIRLEYSQPGETSNMCMELKLTDPEINIKEIEYEKIKKKDGTTDKTDSSESKVDIEKVAALNLISYQPRGRISFTKRPYTYPPFHLLTEGSQAAIEAIDSSWRLNSLHSIAQCYNMPTRVTVQELQIFKLIGSEWFMGAKATKKFDMAFSFLPSKLGLKNLCYPTIPSMFTDVDVHMLCFLVDQVYFDINLAKEHEISLDVPLHFVNAHPITPSPPLNAEQMFASDFNGWVYTVLYSNKLRLPECENLFTDEKPNLTRSQLETMMKSLIHIYTSQCHIFAEQYGGIEYQSTPEDGTQVIQSSIQHLDKNIVKKTSKAEFSSDIFIGKSHRNNVYCKAHQWCLPGTNVHLDGVFDFRPELFSPYEETVNLLWRERLTIPSLPANIYALFPNLQYFQLFASEALKTLPDGISSCLRLEMISFEDCGIETLPSDLFMIPYLKHLFCNALKVKTLPSHVLSKSPITNLTLSNMLLTSIPKELGQLTSLEMLNLNSNPLETLPMELKSLTKLKTLSICGVPWIVTEGSKVEMPLDQFEEFVKSNSTLKNIFGKEKLVSLFHSFDRNNNARLDEGEMAELNAHIFWKVPRLGSACISCSEYGGIPPVIFLLTGLEELNMDFQAITAVPVHMCRLQNLKTLSISNNPLLESLPGALGHLPSLKSLRLISNPSLRTPPNEIVSRGFASIKAYLKRLAGGFTECRRTKLMLVGLGGAGKTSLLKAVMSPNKKTAGTSGEDITNGIDIMPWTVKTNNDIEVTYNTWDFAGQTLYYNTHQFFLSKRAVYLLLWSTRQGYEHAGLEFWLSSIASHAPKTPIFVVGTHCDQVPKADIPVDDLQQKYPQIAGFHFVSSVQGIGIAKLEEDLIQVTLEQKNMGEKVPKVWLNMEKKILAFRSTRSTLPWNTIKEIGMEIGIYDEKDIREAIQFLHELGTVQYFDNDFLRDQVVIDPQWIVNVMSCVVSVKNSPIQDHKGRFLYKYIPEIWRDYPSEQHQWLLRLTEEFDLTFPLPGEELNIVPCLLPQEVPAELQWPLADITKNLKETKLIYKFSYLPAGLFNRAQVRLFHLSDGKLVWKRGSLLKKNKHIALISQISDYELQVKVQGPRPENVIFLIHEIFESLIQESFHGVVYEFHVPCPDCITKEGTLDPSMFEDHLVKRAREHRAPFLQCRKYFHTISMAQLFAIMPSDSDFDAHLQNSLTVMQQLNSALHTDVTILYSSRDKVPNEDKNRINPEQIFQDLEASQLKCWFSSDMDSVSEQNVMLALKNCKVVVALVSDNFERDEKSNAHLLYTMDTLQKDCTIVVIGESLDWQKTDLGMRIGKQEEMIMVRNKSRYDASRIEQMVSAVKGKLMQNNYQIQKHPSVFISYSWSNSKHAQERGTVCPPGAIGWGDPRQVKQELEKRNISCWLDCDQPAAGKGLFKNITEGIRNSKVLVAFVSDEYAKSDNCMMELRFGVLTLELPTIIVVVGTGREWKESEVGLLMQRSKAAKIYMQRENTEAINILERFIIERLPKHADQLIARDAVLQDIKALKQQEKNKQEKKMPESVHDNSAIQEESELVQRKFMRFIISFISTNDSVPTPRLIVIDFEKSAKTLSKKESQNDTDSIASHSMTRPTLRPKTASRTFNPLTNIAENEQNLWESETFCWKILCENEKGWHVCKKSFQVKMSEELKKTIEGCSFYMARMFAILRQSSVSLNCFSGQAGNQFTSWIEQCSTKEVDFLDTYIAFRAALVEDDSAHKFLNQLTRCHLPTGKVYWLCDEHAKGPRITRLSTETATRNEKGKVVYEEDIKLRDILEQTETYMQKKKAKSPAAHIQLPPMLDLFTKDHSSEEDAILIAALSTEKKPVVEPKRNNSSINLTQNPETLSATPTTSKSVMDSSRSLQSPREESKPSSRQSARADSSMSKSSKTCTLQ